MNHTIVFPVARHNPWRAWRFYRARPDVAPRRREVAWALFRTGEWTA